MKLVPSLNAERAEIIRKRFEKETDGAKKLTLATDYAQELLKCGRMKECLDLMAQVSKVIKDNNIQIDDQTKRQLYSIVGIAYMRYGEVENCLRNHNHQSCY